MLFLRLKGFLLAWVLALPLAAGAFSVREPGPPSGEPLPCVGSAVPSGWPDLPSDEGEVLLAPFLSCASPAEFVALQERVDMPGLVEKLGDWGAVRLGALGPIREDVAGLLQRKRVSFLVHACERYGLAHAEVLALFVLHSAHDDEVRELLQSLARDKQLGQTLGRMPVVREELKERGLPLSAFPERAEQGQDILRGLGRAARDALSSSSLSDGVRYMELSALRARLPEPYQKAHQEVERLLMEQHFSPGGVVLGGFDSLTFGVPLGFYHLAVGTAQGAASLTQGQYEQATRELAPAALLGALYAGGRVLRSVADTRGVAGAVPGPRMTQPSLRALLDVARQLEAHLGVEGLRELARDIRASREAGRFVAVGGVDAALALREARGDVAKAQAWLSQGNAERGTSPVSPRSQAAGRQTAKAQGTLSSLVDPEMSLTPEVLDAKLVRVEADAAGPRFTGEVAVLERQRPSLDAPAPGAQGSARWREYVAYYEKRIGELKAGKTTKGPLRWEGYESMRGWFSRGLDFERVVVELLRADALLARSQRRFLGDFESPRIETNVGVWKSDSGLRFADVLVIEQRPPPPGQQPRVETFSLKSRDLSGMGEKALTAQMLADAREALAYYGEELQILRPSLKVLVHDGKSLPIPVQRVRLLYEGGELKATNVKVWEASVRISQARVRRVEVLSQ